jgi:hypothetical protein
MGEQRYRSTHAYSWYEVRMNSQMGLIGLPSEKELPHCYYYYYYYYYYHYHSKEQESFLRSNQVLSY